MEELVKEIDKYRLREEKNYERVELRGESILRREEWLVVLCVV